MAASSSATDARAFLRQVNLTTVDSPWQGEGNDISNAFWTLIYPNPRYYDNYRELLSQYCSAHIYDQIQELIDASSIRVISAGNNALVASAEIYASRARHKSLILKMPLDESKGSEEVYKVNTRQKGENKCILPFDCSDSLLLEYIVGRVVNELRSDPLLPPMTPLTYGVCMTPGTVRNQSVQDFGFEGVVRPVLMQERIPNRPINLYEYIENQCGMCQNALGTGRAFSVLLDILLKLHTMQCRLHFTHYDLSCYNVLVSPIAPHMDKYLLGSDQDRATDQVVVAKDVEAYLADLARGHVSGAHRVAATLGETNERAWNLAMSRGPRSFGVYPERFNPQFDMVLLVGSLLYMLRTNNLPMHQDMRTFQKAFDERFAAPNFKPWESKAVKAAPGVVECDWIQPLDMVSFIVRNCQTSLRTFDEAMRSVKPTNRTWNIPMKFQGTDTYYTYTNITDPTKMMEYLVQNTTSENAGDFAAFLATMPAPSVLIQSFKQVYHLIETQKYEQEVREFMPRLNGNEDYLERLRNEEVGSDISFDITSRDFVLPAANPPTPVAPNYGWDLVRSVVWVDGRTELPALTPEDVTRAGIPPDLVLEPAQRLIYHRLGMPVGVPDAAYIFWLGLVVPLIRGEA